MKRSSAMWLEPACRRHSKARADVSRDSASARPDWPALRQNLAEVIEEFAIAQSQAEDDVQQPRRARPVSSSRSVKRPAASTPCSPATKKIDWRPTSTIRPPPTFWTGSACRSASLEGLSARMLEELRGAAEDLQRSEQLALEDLRLAAQATSEINEAARSIRQSGGYSSMGFSTDTSLARVATEPGRAVHANPELRAGDPARGRRDPVGACRRITRRCSKRSLRQAMMAADQRRQAARSSAPPWNGVSFGAAAADRRRRRHSGTRTAPLRRPSPVRARAATRASASAPGPTRPDAGQGNW